jgi:hypothetical protein
MDTSLGMTWARLVGEEDLQTKGSRYQQLQNRCNRNAPDERPREVLCYCCQKPGHMIKDCPQPPQQKQWYPRQNDSQGHQVESLGTDENEQIARLVSDNRTPQPKAKDWLQSVANEDDNVKDIIMQKL